MLGRNLIGAIALAAAMHAPPAGAQLFDLDKYPDLKGQWRAIGDPTRFDASKPAGLGQEAPLDAEYEAIFKANLDDEATSGSGAAAGCLSPGMPRVANGYGEIEFVITPDETHVLVQHIHDNRRIFTDGRDWPAEIEPSFVGYSIGRWIDSEASGRYDTLEIETRGFKGPRVFDDSGIPLHSDNQTIVKERIYLDKADRKVLHDEITVIDHALTRPWTWTVIKGYHLNPNPRPAWREVNCNENNNRVQIGAESYMLGADGLLMPTRKNQAPPDMRYFKQSQK